MEEILCSERISPFIHSFHEDNILPFSVHKIALDVPLFLTRGLLLENIGECIKTLPCDLQRNDHGHEIVLNQIKDDMLHLFLILIENIGECIKTLPCGLQQNDHGHEIVLNRIKDGMLSL